MNRGQSSLQIEWRRHTDSNVIAGGAGVTIKGAPGSILDGNGQAYWDGQGSNGGVPKSVLLPARNLPY